MSKSNCKSASRPVSNPVTQVISIVPDETPRVQSEQSPLSPALLTIPQAAEYLGAATEWAVRRLIYSGKLPYIKIGKRFNIRRKDLDAFIESNVQWEGRAA